MAVVAAEPLHDGRVEDERVQARADSRARTLVKRQIHEELQPVVVHEIRGELLVAEERRQVLKKCFLVKEILCFLLNVVS